VTADGTGAFNKSVTIPIGTALGAHNIGALGGTSGKFASAFYNASNNAIITPTSGASGSSASVTGHGFNAGESVTIKWNCGSLNCGAGTLLATATADGSGNVTQSVTIPAASSIGSHSIGVQGVTSSKFSLLSYSVTS